MAKRERAWRRTADAAISQVERSRERERLALGIAATLHTQEPNWNPHTASQQLPKNSVSESQVLHSLALKHLQLITEARDLAEYEDVASLDAEVRWKTTYFEHLLQCPLSTQSGQSEMGPLLWAHTERSFSS